VDNFVLDKVIKIFLSEKIDYCRTACFGIYNLVFAILIKLSFHNVKLLWKMCDGSDMETQ